jgi:Zn-dependent protease
MRPTSNDISFNLFGFPTDIHPFFWLTAALIAALNLGAINDNMPIWIARLLAGITGVLLSILVHELGHALVFRYLFRTSSGIVLHGFGGTTLPLQHFSRRCGFRGTLAHCFLSFAGPLAGFLLAFVMIGLRYVTPADVSPALVLFRYFLSWTAAISIFWGIINLLPIYPMDGGHISREIFLFFSPRQGVQFSLGLSMMIAALLAVLALQYNVFITFFFVYFAYQNYQEMTFRSFRR